MEVLDIGGLDRPRFAAVLGLQQAVDRQLDPDLPPTTADELLLLATMDRTENAEHRRVAAFEDDRPVALGHLELGNDPANPGLASAEVAWCDDTDGNRAVLADLLEVAEDDGRRSLIGWGRHDEPQSTFWTGVGATQRYLERISRLDLAEVDESLMTAWINGRRERAADVELVAWVGVCPAEHLDALVAARNAMNDAPIDDIDMADVVHTPASTRREELAYAAIGWEILGVLALASDGTAAGMTIVLLNTHRPAASWQGDTVVLEPHRGRGIGRWLKAEMWRSLRLDRPEVTTLRTGNAESNAAMLSINEAMGYRPVHTMAVWQAETPVLRRGLATRAAAGSP